MLINSGLYTIFPVRGAGRVTRLQFELGAKKGRRPVLFTGSNILLIFYVRKGMFAWFAAINQISAGNDRMLFRDQAYTDWLPVKVPAPAGKLVITGLPEQKPESCSIMIAVGIAFGTIQRGEIEQVKYVGAGKVIGME